jgi:hypothetical protein
MRVERLLRKMEERSKRRQKRKDEVGFRSFYLNFIKFFLFFCFSGQVSIREKYLKDMMIQLKWEIFVMQKKIWEIIF